MSFSIRRHRPGHLWALLLVLTLGYGSLSIINMNSIVEKMQIESSGSYLTPASESAVIVGSSTGDEGLVAPLWTPMSSTPRFLLGIFSHDNAPQEVTRRQTIRDTYLQYYRSSRSNNNETPNRICSMNAILSKSVVWRDCQVAYVFVVGDKHASHNRTQYLEATSTQELALEADEPDVLRLNILENGEYGKSPTWLRYATLLLKENADDWQYDYIIKSDSDTLLIPHRFLRWVEQQENSFGVADSSNRRRIYGGTPMDRYTCGYPDHKDCNKLQTPAYMGGAFYFLSADLATAVSSPDGTIGASFLPHEDMYLGNLVYVYASTVAPNRPFNETIHLFSNPDAYQNMWRHPVKYPKRMKTLWRNMLQKQRERKQKKVDLSLKPLIEG